MIEAAGLDPDDLPRAGAIYIGIDVGARQIAQRCKDIWSAGIDLGADAVPPVDELVAIIAKTARLWRGIAPPGR